MFPSGTACGRASSAARAKVIAFTERRRRRPYSRSLQRFSVRANRLSGTLPSLAGLSALQEILVDGNALSGALPAAPASLLPGQSTLCPNAFDRVDDAAWDAAVGETPWWSAPALCGDLIFADGFELSSR